MIETVEQAIEARLEQGLEYTLSTEERAYLAGLFDGEGCASIEREVRHDRGGKVRFRHVISVSNTDREVVEVMRAMTGHGSINSVKRDITKNPAAANWKTLFKWTCKGGQAVHILETILPYLRIKKPQAALVLTLGATEESWTKVKQLNFRGVALQKDEAVINGYNEDTETHTRHDA